MAPLSKTAADFSRQLGAAVATLTDASALKMCYGALNKTQALWLEVLIAPQRLGRRWLTWMAAFTAVPG